MEIDDSFLYEHVLVASQNLIKWFADFANYVSRDAVPSDLTFHQCKKFMHDVKKFFWDEYYLYQRCADGITCPCVPEVHILIALEACHSSLVGGKHGGI